MATRASNDERERGGSASSSSSSSVVSAGGRRTTTTSAARHCRRLSIGVLCLATTTTSSSSAAAVVPSSARWTPGGQTSSGASLLVHKPPPRRRRCRGGRRASSSSSSSTTSGAVGMLRGGGGDEDDDDDGGVVASTTGGARGGRKKKKRKRVPKGGGGTSQSGEGGGTTTTGTAAAVSTPRDDEDDDDDLTTTGSVEARDAIDGAMKGRKDAASALGDAIRERAEILRRDDGLSASSSRRPSSSSSSSPLGRLDGELISLGLSMGTARIDECADDDDDEDEDDRAMMMTDRVGGVDRRRTTTRGTTTSAAAASPSPLATYFLRTHGGTHAVQCLLSLLASALGVACLTLPPFPSTSTYRVAATGGRGTTTAVDDDAAVLLSRCILLSTDKCRLMQMALVIAMAKHASGMLGAVNVGASLIPTIGVRDARRRLESIASDPVGQYLFYCSLLVVWVGWFGGGGGYGGGGMGGYVSRLRGTVASIMNNAAATATADGAAATVTATAQLLDALSRQPPPWFMCQSPCGAGSVVPILVLAPILLREVVSVIWVCSDVLTLLSSSSGGGGVLSAVLSRALSTSCASIDAFMTLLIAPDRWRDANSFQRQQTLSSLVSRCSLLTELVVGGILIADAAQSFWTFAFIGPTTSIPMVGTTSSGGGKSSPFGRVVGKTACAHLYLNFLLSRRRKIAAAVGSIRGGALVNRVLDILIDPRKETGLAVDNEDNDEE